MKPLACLALLLLAVNLADAKPPKRKVKPAGDITFAVAKDGSGYVFYRDGRRIAYSKPGDQPDSQIVYMTPYKKTKKDTEILTVTKDKAEWVNPFFAGSDNNPFSASDDLSIAAVVRKTPDAADANKRLPMVHIDPPAPQTMTIAEAAKLDIKVFANKLGGYSFTHNDSVILFSRAVEGGQELVEPRKLRNVAIYLVTPTEVSPLEMATPQAETFLAAKKIVPFLMKHPAKLPEKPQTLEELLTK